MIPIVKEYLGLLEDQKVIEKELKRCFEDYKKIRNRLQERKKPLDTRLQKLEEDLKKSILAQNLRGVKYKQYIVAIEEKSAYKPPLEKIIEALENNPVEHYSHDKKMLAKIIADAVKKKCKQTKGKDKNDLSGLCIKIKSVNT